MKTTAFIFLILLFLTAQKTLAVSNACSLLQSELPADIQMTVEEVTAYRQKLQNECWWMQAYQNFKTQLESKHRLIPEQISEYQAMRFIRRGDYETARSTEVPVELIYQIKRDQYQLPLDQRSPIIWQNWSKGILQLNNLRSAIQNGEHFTYAKLEQAHVNFFQLSDEVGDDANPPHPGIMKPPMPMDYYWWELTPQEAPEAKAVTNAINKHYRELGLLPNFPEAKLNLVIDVRQALKRQPPDKKNVIEYVWAVFSGQTRANRTHLQNILKFVQDMMTQSLQDKPLIWNGKAMTPAEVALLAQKFYVGVHPFAEGNGRTGRLMQELILTVMEMPHGSSGDLMDYDVLTTFPDYYRRAMQANVQLMQKMKTCLEIYEQNQPAQLIQTDQRSIDYSCRILKTSN
jgi:hypothetical protein